MARIAILFCFTSGAAALGVGAWLLLTPDATLHRPAPSRPPMLTTAEVTFPDPLSASAEPRVPVTPPPAKVTPPPAKVTPPPAKVTPPPAKATPPPAKVTPPPAKATPPPPPDEPQLTRPPDPLAADFDDGQLPPWLEQRVATGEGVGVRPGVGEKVVLSFKRLRLMGMVQRRGGAVVTAPLPLVRGHCLIIEKRTRIHPGSTVSGSETVVLSGDERARLATLGYLQDDGVESFVLGEGPDHVDAPSAWDRWFDETITYDPLSGALFVEIDGDPPSVHEQRPATGPIRVGFTASGRGSGHLHEIDRLKIYWEPCQLGEGDE